MQNCNNVRAQFAFGIQTLQMLNQASSNVPQRTGGSLVSGKIVPVRPYQTNHKYLQSQRRKQGGRGECILNPNKQCSRSLSSNKISTQQETAVPGRRLKHEINRAKHSPSLPSHLSSNPAVSASNRSKPQLSDVPKITGNTQISAKTAAKPPFSSIRPRRVRDREVMQQVGNSSLTRALSLKNQQRISPQKCKTSKSFVHQQNKVSLLRSHSFHPSCTTAPPPRVPQTLKARSSQVISRITYRESNPPTVQHVQSGSKFDSGSNPSEQVGKQTPLTCQRSTRVSQNFRKTEFLLKFEAKRLRFNAHVTDRLERNMRHNECHRKPEDNLAAWELSEQEVLQSCRSEDLLILKEALSRSSPHSYLWVQFRENQQSITTHNSSRESLEIIQRRVSREQTSEANVFEEHGVSCPAIHEENQPGLEKEDKTHSVYTSDGSSTSASSSLLPSVPSSCFTADTECALKHNIGIHSSVDPNSNKTTQMKKLGGKECETQRSSKSQADHSNPQPLQQNPEQESISCEPRAEPCGHPQSPLRPQEPAASEFTGKHLQNLGLGILSQYLQRHMEQFPLKSYMFVPACSSTAGDKDSALLTSSKECKIAGTHCSKEKNRKCRPGKTRKPCVLLNMSPERAFHDPAKADSAQSNLHASSTTAAANNSSTRSKLEAGIRHSCTQYKPLTFNSKSELPLSVLTRRFLRAEVCRAASNGYRNAFSNVRPRKTPYTVWRWRIFVFFFLVLSGISVFIASFATALEMS